MDTGLLNNYRGNVVYMMMRDNGVNGKTVSKPNQTSSIVYRHEVGLI
jgi:hypothetical protein